MELETDKAVVEVPSSVTGIVGEVRVKEGDKVRTGQVIFTVENGAGASRQAAAAASSAAPVAEKQTAAKAPASKTALRPRGEARLPPVQRQLPPDFKLPELGENIDSGDLVRLMISPGPALPRASP